MLLMSSVVLLMSGHSAWTIWSQLPFFQMWVMLLFHFIGIHGLWGSPIYGWLLMVSAWARRAPILWAVLPPLAIGFGEKVAFKTTHFGNLIASRFTGGSEGTTIMEHHMSMNPAILLAPAHFLLNPGLWIGFAITAAFLAAATSVRRYRGPI
jgi:ABC-2 type transport system permease protein